MWDCWDGAGKTCKKHDLVPFQRYPGGQGSERPPTSLPFLSAPDSCSRVRSMFLSFRRTYLYQTQSCDVIHSTVISYIKVKSQESPAALQKARTAPSRRATLQRTLCFVLCGVPEGHNSTRHSPSMPQGSEKNSVYCAAIASPSAKPSSHPRGRLVLAPSLMQTAQRGQGL